MSHGFLVSFLLAYSLFLESIQPAHAKHNDKPINSKDDPGLYFYNKMPTPFVDSGTTKTLEKLRTSFIQDSKRVEGIQLPEDLYKNNSSKEKKAYSNLMRQQFQETPLRTDNIYSIYSETIDLTKPLKGFNAE